jgi:hypothetical protein
MSLLSGLGKQRLGREDVSGWLRNGKGQVAREDGNHRCSLSTCMAYGSPLGSRTDMSSPRRKLVLSQPSSSSSTGVRADPLRAASMNQIGGPSDHSLKSTKDGLIVPTPSCGG